MYIIYSEPSISLGYLIDCIHIGIGIYGLDGICDINCMYVTWFMFDRSIFVVMDG